MAVLTGVSVVIGAAPVLWLINADMQEAGFGVALFMAALAGCFASIAGNNTCLEKGCCCMASRHDG